jgi:phospholipid/cholesterol/gamma-HCH transport system substrate-binding protein
VRSRFLPYQLGAFALIALLGVLYVEFSVVGVHVFSQTYHVTVEMPDAGGIFPHANVDYRGQQVGTVASVQLRRDGVAVDLEIDPGVQVPDDATATVTALSGVGEQYVDLRPGRSSPPYLHDGSVIPASRAAIAIPIATLLVDTETLVHTLSPADITTVVDQFAAGFGGNGQQMRDLISSSATLLASLQAAAPQTVDLEQSARVQLQTADQARGEFSQFSLALAQLTTQLKASDGDIRALIDNGSAAMPQIASVVRDDSPSLAVLLGNTVTFGNIAVARVPAYKQFLVVFPDFGGKLASTVKGDTIMSRGYVNSQNTVCAYLPPGLMRSPLDNSTRVPFFNADCSATAADMLQRGARNAPRPAGDSTATQHSTVAGGSAGSGAAQVASSDAATGLLTAPDGSTVKLGWTGGQDAAFGRQSWYGLLLAAVEQ